MMNRDNAYSGASIIVEEGGVPYSGPALTTEQNAIIASEGNIRINAVAGSGKTTTLIEYARSRPRGARMLYLAFNKSVQQEALERFRAQQLLNVSVETTHSLAYRHIVPRFGYTVRNAYKTQEIVTLLGLQGFQERHTEFIIANHINKFITLFCNSSQQKVQELNYLDVVHEPASKAFVRTFYKAIEQGTRMLLAKMNSGEAGITHDFYLKKFQLAKPQLDFDYILFDEGQDASAAMLDVFARQKAVKVMVGDTHQSIYSWRYATNALETLDYKSFSLTTSFRFPPGIADLAKKVLAWKRYISDHTSVTIKGFGTHREPKSKATIGRTNLGLLMRAIEFISDHPDVKQLYFEGNFNSYVYADDGASLYDILNLSEGKSDLIRDPLIRSMNSLEELEDYIGKTEDVPLGLMLEIVREYGKEIPSLIRRLKTLQVPASEKDQAEMIFSTVHKSKGLEYDAVQLVPDFITEGKLERLTEDEKREALKNGKFKEEINLLYVAITRTRWLLRIPEMLVPKDFPPASNIILLPAQRKRSSEPEASREDLQSSFLQSRQAQKAAVFRWKPEMDDLMKEL
ncbi:MAG TPA: UvrD-helicase domain-containing protein, partial [Flavisolibacter sp.]|nr:UvrD-helicase domain-containing protein [Flavisolibacter sp.]